MAMEHSNFYTVSIYYITNDKLARSKRVAIMILYRVGQKYLNSI